jgi:hypothetical protein
MEPEDGIATLTDEEIETRRAVGAPRPSAGAISDTGDDTGDTTDTSDTGDDTGDTSDTSDTGDDSASVA